VRQAWLLTLLGQQHLECAGISAAREQLIAIDQIEQCHRFFAQGMDHVMIVDDVAVLAAACGGRHAARSGAAWSRGSSRADRRRVNIETMADQTR